MTRTDVREKGTVRIAVVGAGNLATRVHYPSLASFPDVEIAGICDLDGDRLAATGDRYGIVGRYTDYRAMVEAVAPDGIYVIGQPQFMYDVWVWCLQQGLPLYIEKPMGLTWHQAQVLAYLARERNVITQVGHQRRSCPLLVMMRELCLAQAPITHATCEFFKCAMTPFLDARDHMLDDCVHAIDTVRWMCGGEVVDVISHCKRVGVPDINWIGATLQFDTGATGSLITSWCSGRRLFRVQMHAPGIYAEAEPEGIGRVFAGGDEVGIVYDAREVAGSSDFFVYAGFQAKSREFIDSLKHGVEVTSSPFRDCLKTMEVAERILAAALLAGA